MRSLDPRLVLRLLGLAAFVVSALAGVGAPDPWPIHCSC